MDENKSKQNIYFKGNIKCYIRNSLTSAMFLKTFEKERSKNQKQFFLIIFIFFFDLKEIEILFYQSFQLKNKKQKKK